MISEFRPLSFEPRNRVSNAATDGVGDKPEISAVALGYMTSDTRITTSARLIEGKVIEVEE
jgi:hypothetical protein